MNIYCYKRVSVELARWYPHRRIRRTTDKDRSSALGSLEVSHLFHHATAHPIVYWKNNLYIFTLIVVQYPVYVHACVLDQQSIRGMFKWYKQSILFDSLLTRQHTN